MLAPRRSLEGVAQYCHSLPRTVEAWTFLQMYSNMDEKEVFCFSSTLTKNLLAGGFRFNGVYTKELHLVRVVHQCHFLHDHYGKFSGFWRNYWEPLSGEDS